MSQAGPGAGSSHQSSTGQATGSGNQTNWDHQGARPKHQTNTLYSTEDTSVVETRHFPITYEESWDKVTVEIQIQEGTVFINYGENDIPPFEVQYMCSVADLKNSVDVLSDRFALEDIRNNVIVAKLKFGDQSVRDLKNSFLDILKSAFGEYLSLPVAEKDFCLLEDFASKSPEVRYYRHKSPMYICGKKTSINGIKTKLEYPREEVQIGKDAMLLFQEYTYFKHQCFGGVTIVPMNEEMVVCSCSDRKRVQEAVDILRKEKSQVTSSLMQGVHISEDMKQQLKNKHVMVEVSETDEVKLIFRNNQKPEIDKILHQLVSSHTQENQQRNNYEGIKSTNALQKDDAQVPELPKKTRRYMQDEVWTCDSLLCAYFKQHGIKIIENLETEQNVSIEIGEDQIRFTGNKDNIHRSVLSLKWHMMSNSLIVPNDRGNLCQWATTPAGKEVLGQITGSLDCGWTLVPVSPADNSTPKRRKGVLPFATWTLTTPLGKNHRLSVCVVEDFGQTDLKEIIIPVFTDQTPLHNVATLQLGEFTNLHVRNMKNGELVWKQTKTPDRNIMLVALAEKMKDNKSETITVPDTMALQEYFRDMFRYMHKQTEVIAFVVPQSSYLKEWKLLMQSLVLAFQGEFQNIFSDTPKILLCCQRRFEALCLLDVVHNLCCKNMLGTFDTSTPVVMSKRIRLEVIQTSLLKLQVDCIVVMVSRDLDLSKGAIPKQLSNEVGPELQKCIKDLKVYHLTDGQCFFLQLPKPLTSGIKSVIFGYLPKWQNKGHLETLRQFIQSCLHTAAIRECSSLGFPAIGTGYLGYSQRSVTRTMFDTVEQFSREAMCAGLERVMVAIVDQNDLMWKMMKCEEERRKNMAYNGFKKCQAIPYLEKKMNGLYVKVVAKESLLCPLPSDWVLVEFKCKKEKDQPFDNNFCVICCESETNDHVEVYCLDSGKNLKDQMKEVFSWCEKQMKIDCLAIYCSHSFSLSVACQVENITEALQDTYTSSIRNVLIITPDESGLQNAEQVLHKDDTPLTTFIEKLTKTKQSVWQKKPGEPCHMLVVFGQGNQVTKAVSSIQQQHSQMLASGSLKDAKKSDNGSDDDGSDNVHGSFGSSDSKLKRPSSNSSTPLTNRQQPSGEKTPAHTDEDSGSYVDLKQIDVPSSPVSEDDIKSLFAHGEAVSVINSTILKQMKDSGQAKLTIDYIVKEYSVKFLEWKGESIFCGSLDAVAEVEQFLWGQPTLGAFPYENLDDKQSKQKNQSASIADSVDREAEGKKPVVVYSGLKIFAYTQDILQTRVEAIVRPTNEYMAGSTGLATVISDAAGAAMVEECKQSLKNEGKLQWTECRVTKAGNLAFSRIIHVHVNRLKVTTMLQTAILNCLKKAEEFGVTSLVIPLIGTGSRGQDIKLCATQYLDAVKEFFREGAVKALKEIHFVDENQEKILTVLNELEKRISGDKTQGLKGDFRKGSQKNNRPGCESFDKNEGQSRHTADRMNTPYNTFKIDTSNCNVTLHVGCGDITKLSLDAIVCPQDTRFSGKGMIAGTIWKLSGQSHKNKLQEEKKKTHKIGDTVMIAPEGDMTCRMVIYAVSPHWTRDYTTFPKKFEDEIAATVDNCLQQVSALKYASVAFPLLGTSDDENARQTPLATCCERMITGVLQFCKLDCSSSSPPLHVYLVSMDQAVVVTFNNELSNMLSGIQEEPATHIRQGHVDNTLPETRV